MPIGGVALGRDCTADLFSEYLTKVGMAMESVSPEFAAFHRINGCKWSDHVVIPLILLQHGGGFTYCWKILKAGLLP